MGTPDSIVLSCEHAGNRVPARYAFCFARARAALASHRGYDLGALPLARALSGALDAPLEICRVTRLLVDTNRSAGHPDLFSRFSRRLSDRDRARILEEVYEPHRGRVRSLVDRLAARGEPVLHVGVHTFTPRLRGKVRDAHVGLLYDPSRAGEPELCRRWRFHLETLAPRWRVRLNYPYRGWTDGLVASLRERYPPALYLGVELEVQQRLLRSSRRAARRAARLVARALRLALESVPSRS